MGEVVNFPKAKRPVPAGHEGGEQPGLRVLGHGPIVRPAKRPSWGVFDDHDGDTPDAA